MTRTAIVPPNLARPFRQQKALMPPNHVTTGLSFTRWPGQRPRQAHADMNIRNCRLIVPIGKEDCNDGERKIRRIIGG